MTEASLRHDRAFPPAAAAVCACVIALGVAVVSGHAVGPTAALTVAIALVAVSPGFFTRWEVLVAGIVAVILFVPIKRYKLPGDLPFDLELYRIVVALVAALWLLSLLIDRRVVLRRTALDGPLLFIGAAVLGSVLTNLGTIAGEGADPRLSANLSLADEVVKTLLFLLSIVLVFYMVVSVVNSVETLHTLLKTLVGGATVVAVLALVEARTQYNVFDHLSTVLPFLSFDPSIAGDIFRGGADRVYGSSQSPIALGAMFVMLVPLALYLVHATGQRRWWISGGLMALGALSSLSRTAATMFLAMAVVFLLLRSAEIKRLLPLVVPALVVIHAILPGAIGSYRQAFFPTEGIVQEQTDYKGRVSSERLGPQFEAIREQPLFGIGYGTRVTAGPTQNALILDNQWLGTTVETGIVGLVSWIWFFAVFIRRLGREARRDPSPRGLLLTGLVSAIAGYAVGMLTYDAFTFIQVTFVMFILAAIGVRALDRQLWAQERVAPGSPDRLAGSSV